MGSISYLEREGVMEKILEKFNVFFEEENKEEGVNYIIDMLEKQEIDVISLYEEVLTPALNEMVCRLEDKRICIWKEHVKTAIVRTIVECSYPYVIKERNKRNLERKGIAVVLCPPEEYHDLGARMAADFFTICGYESVFIGSNTPYKDFYNAIDVIRPEIIAISVSDYYNLVVTKKLIAQIKGSVNYPITIAVGGQAFNSHPEHYQLVGADFYIKDFQDIVKISEVNL